MKIYIVGGQEVILHEDKLYVEAIEKGSSGFPELFESHHVRIEASEPLIAGQAVAIIGNKKKKGRRTKAQIEADNARQHRADDPEPTDEEMNAMSVEITDYNPDWLKKQIKDLRAKGMNSAAIAKECRVKLADVNKHWN